MIKRWESGAPAAVLFVALLACKGVGGGGGEAKPTGPAVSVSAADLFKDYDANEVAADEKYKGKHLIVGGKLSSIDKDFADNIVLKLDTGKPYHWVSATMKDSEKSKAAGQTKGQTVSLDCTGGTMIIKSPTLKDCTIR